ncbi:MAG: DUF547 domain-containing protein [Balneolaceae bacterium]|nr:DUF547 domain-containing protein [Balneolaceae bacterium]
MKRLFLVLLCVFIVSAIHAQPAVNTFFKEADTFFAENITNKLVDYRGIQKEPAELNQLVRTIARMSIDKMNPDQEKAFYINSYNLLTIHSIIENGIPDSPLDVEGFFDKQKHTVDGGRVTLDKLEKEMLFPAFPDARVHFVLVCAAKGCPPIRPYAYVPENLDEQIHKATINTLNYDYFIRHKPEQGKVLISEIFKWYKSDFLAKAESVVAYINQYRNKKLDDDVEVDFYSYDWSLNIME